MALPYLISTSLWKWELWLRRRRGILQLETLGERRNIDIMFQCRYSLWHWVSLGNMKTLPEWQKKNPNRCGRREHFSAGLDGWLACGNKNHLTRWLCLAHPIQDGMWVVVNAGGFHVASSWGQLAFLPGSLETHCFEPNEALEREEFQICFRTTHKEL